MHQAVVVRGADGAAGAVVDVDVDVVATADHAIAGGDRHGAVVDVAPERAAVAALCSRGLVESGADVLAAGDQHGVLGPCSATAARQSASAAA